MATRYNYTGGIVTDGLLVHLDPARRDSHQGSGTVWKDLTDNHHDFTLTNSPAHSGFTKGSTFNFDGSNEHAVIAGDAINYSRTGLTVECFCYFNANYANYRGGIITKWHTGAGDSNEWWFGSLENASSQTGPGILSLGIERPEGGSTIAAHGSTSTSSQTWHHAVGTFDGATIKVYLNGSLDGSTASPVTEYKTYTSQPTTIAAFGSSFQYPTNIQMGPVRIYNRALTASEITQNYNAQKSRYGL